MRVLLDTNILISNLLPGSHAPGAASQIVEAAFAHAFTLLLPEQAIHELRTVVATKPYFAARITPDEVEGFIEALSAVADVLPDPPGPIPAIVRDPDDDFILAHAIMSEADFLISGDKDLLVLREAVHPLRILPPSEFLWNVPRRD